MVVVMMMMMVMVMMMMMMMMMMMRRLSSLRVRAKPRHLPYYAIYIYIDTRYIYIYIYRQLLYTWLNEHCAPYPLTYPASIPNCPSLRRPLGCRKRQFLPKTWDFCVAKMVCWIMVARRIPAFGDDDDDNDQSYCCKVRITIY